MNEVDLEIYLIRHAESVLNTQEEIIGGRSNESPLTPLGMEQARKLGAYMARLGFAPDKVIASPAVRATETMRISMEAMGVEYESVIDDNLQELDQGKWTGLNRYEIYTPEVLADIDRLGKDFKADGGESMNECGIQMFNFLPDKDYIPARVPERWFVYAHGAKIRCGVSYIFDWTQRQTYEAVTNNTSMTLLVRRNGQWELEYLGKEPDIEILS